MEVLFKRKIKFATIKLLKNYSLISEVEKQKDENIFSNRNIDFFNITPKIKNRKTKYFHDSDYINIVMDRAVFRGNNIFVTEKDRHIKRHYGNPFAEITINNIERKIFIKENRLIIDLYIHKSTREFNSIYFKNIKIKQTIIFDLIKGNIHTVIINDKVKSFRINSFKHLTELINNTNLFKKQFNQFNLQENKLIENLYDDEIWDVLANFFGYENNLKNKFLKFIVNKFIEFKRYKLPNNFNWKTVPLYYPTQKLISKNKNNIINAYLDKFGIKSKSTIRILNQYPDLEITYLAFLCRLFGRDYGKYLSHINFNNFLRIDSNLFEYDENRLVVNPYMINKNYLQENDFNLSCVDKTNLIKLINHGFAEEKVKICSHEIIRYLYDHFKMLNKLRQYGIKINMKAKTINELTIEHGELSLLLSKLKKKYFQEMVFDEKLIQQIEYDYEIITDDNGIGHELFCYILKSELEYDEEGTHMHHCVASYVDNENSLIISIRDKNTRDRVTCEFNNISGELLQAKYFCNQKPPEYFNNSIKNLVQNIDRLKKQKLLKYKTKKTILNESYIVDENEQMFI